jgi:hypothetical protein
VQLDSLDLAAMKLLPFVLLFTTLVGAQNLPLLGARSQTEFDLKGDVLGEHLPDAKFSKKDAMFVGSKKISDAEFATIWRGKSTFANFPAQFVAEFHQVGLPESPVFDPDKAYLYSMKYIVEFEDAEREAEYEAILTSLIEKYGTPQKSFGTSGAIWERTDSDGKLSVLAMTNVSTDDRIRVILQYGKTDI